MSESRIELYTTKFDTTISYKSAKLAIIASATRGKVEDVNEVMNILVTHLREIDEVKEDAS